MTAQILVIGLDGGTFDLLLPLMEEGYMPQLKGLLEEGSWGRLESTIPPFTAAAWSTFATGQNPGKHGILSFQKSNRFNYNKEVTGFNDARQLRNPLWESLSAAGKRVAFINVPLSYPPRSVNGVMVTGMMTPANSSEFTYPQELASTLEGYRIDVEFIRDGDSFRRYDLPSKLKMLADIHAVTRQRTVHTLKLLQQESWDFFMVVYTGTDRISHFFWDDLQSLWDKRPLSPSHKSPHFSDLMTYFRDLDNDLSQLIEASGSDAHILFMSDHGFGNAPTKRFNINIWLEQLELLTPCVPQNIKNLAYWRMRVGRNTFLKKTLRFLMSQKIQDKLSHKAGKQSGGVNIEWTRTQAYFVPIYFHVCGIEINTVDEHCEGIVSLGDEYESIRSRIINVAQKIQDPDSGENIVEVAARREELFSGPYVTQFPDVIIVLKPEYVGGQSLAGNQLIEPHAPFRSGEHRSDGIFAAIGPHIRKLANVPDLQLADASATACYLLGLPVPTNYDGRVLRELIDTEYWNAKPPQYQQLEEEIEISETKLLYSVDEEAEIVERLRSLGYLE